MTLVDDGPARTDPPRAGVECCSFSSRDEDEIADFVRSTYVGGRARFSPAAEGARFDARCAATADLAADEVRSTIDYAVDAEPFDHFFSFVVQHGRVEVARTGEKVRLDVGDVATLTVDSGVVLRVSDMGAGLVRLPLHRIHSVAEEIVGRPVQGFTFESMVPVSSAMHRYWRSTSSLARNALMAPSSPLATDLLREETIRAVSLAALHTFPNAVMRSGTGRAGQVAPVAVRRAAAYIDDHADLPLTLTDIAVAAGTGTRALQYGFQRHYGTTPMGYLRIVRLERAHRDLRAADPTTGETVADIARRWGFGNLSRFARVYRDRFGVPPSRTLRT